MKHEEPIRCEALPLEQRWDKIFPQQSRVLHRKVTFANHFGITLAADVYMPDDAADTAVLPAIAVCGPFGAVKEQAAGFYAQTLASYGFYTLAFDPSFTGESGGTPRGMAAPDINIEDFCAAVDHLSVQSGVDENRICLLGIGGWSALALEAAALDTRICASVCVSPEDPGRLLSNGRFDAQDDPQARLRKKQALNLQRTKDARRGSYRREALTPPHGADRDERDAWQYFQTPRGFHKRAPDSLHGWNTTGCMAFLQHDGSSRIRELKSAVLLVQGENADMNYFGEELFALLPGKSNELYTVPGIGSVALYDDDSVIPFERIAQFLQAQTREHAVAKRSRFEKAATRADLPTVIHCGTDAAPAPLAMMLAVMLNADLCAAGQKMPEILRRKQSKYLFLQGPLENGVLPEALLTFLTAEQFKGKRLLLVLEGDAAAADRSAIEAAIHNAAPHCKLTDMIFVPENASVETVAGALAPCIEREVNA